MGAPRAPLNILVGGTNGKGSTVAFLEAMLRAAGKRVGAYTSPHLRRYNERVRIAGADASDSALCAAFARVEAARGAIALTFFEFGTLAALDLFALQGVEVAVLEVGLGGRLDATNIIDADAAIITTVDMDHMQWLGDTRDAIGVEKAGIARSRRPLVIADADPPRGLLDTAEDLGARMLRAGLDFSFEAAAADGHWRWRGHDGWLLELPPPRLQAPCQRANAAAAIAALQVLAPCLSVPAAAIAEGVASASVSGRLERLRGTPELVVDVAHNAQAARALAAWLDRQPRRGQVRAVFGALADKDIGAVLAAIGARVDAWYLASLDADTARGLTAAALQPRLRAALPGCSRYSCHADVAAALQAAQAEAAAADTLLAFGSFFVVAAAVTWHDYRLRYQSIAQV